MVKDAGFGNLITATLGERTRVLKDAEGWAYVPALHGRIEFRGLEPDGSLRLYAYTHRPRLIAKFRAIPGLNSKQIGDQEAVFWLHAEDREALLAVGRLLQTRRKRPPVGRSKEQLDAIRPVLSKGNRPKFRPEGPDAAS